MQRTGKLALFAAIAGPIQGILGWAIAGAMWPKYDWVYQTISDLAAPESPVNAIMSSFFVFGSTLTLLIALDAKTLSKPGRVALFISGICGYGLSIFPTPLIGYSVPHRIFAITSFILSAIWPLLSMSKREDAPAIIKPKPAIIATVLQVLLAGIFLVVWADPNATNVGVWERLVTVSQAGYMSLVVLFCYAVTNPKTDLERKG